MYQSSADAKEQYIDKMGDQLGQQFHALWQEVALLHINWKEYIDLFGTNEERISKLNLSAPAFFRMIQDQLWTSTLLHIARLTDSPSTAGYKNLTIRNLTDLVAAEIKMPIAEAIDKTLASSKFARDWRNKVIAHFDLALALKDGQAAKLEEASYADVKVVLQGFSEVLNLVHRHYLKGITSFDSGGRHNGAMTLLQMLTDGLKVRTDREKHLKAVADGLEKFDPTKFQ